MSGTDPSKYSILSIVHDGQLYRTPQDLVDAWSEGRLAKSLPTSPTWATRALTGKTRDLDDRAGPRSVHFDGARYRLDPEEQYVTWMGWSFYLGFERDMGVHLWNM